MTTSRDHGAGAGVTVTLEMCVRWIKRVMAGTLTGKDDEDLKAILQWVPPSNDLTAGRGEEAATARGEWVLVPREPTREMLARFRGLNRVRDTESRARLDWQDMLAALPAPPEALGGKS